MLLLGFGLFLLYALSASSAPGFEDGAMLTFSCLYGDIAHAPGYPLYALLCRPFALLPFSPVLAASLFSAACAAAACVVLVKILYLMTADGVISFAAATLFGLSRSFWGQANIPEVYALNVLLFFVAWWLLLNWRRKPTVKLLCGFVFVCGLAVANHWPLFLLAAGGFLPLMWRKRKWLWQSALRRPLFFPAVFASLALGLSPYAYLIWRAHHPAVMLGLPFAPDDWRMFWQIVSREVLFAVDKQDGAGWADKRGFAVFLSESVFVKEIGPLGGVLLVVGFFRQWRVVGVSSALFLCFVFFGTVGGLVLLLNFLHEPLSEQIFSVYPLLPYAVACVWAGLALRRYKWRAAVLALVCVYALVANFSVNNRRADSLSTDIAATYLRALPEGGFFAARGLLKLLSFQQYHESPAAAAPAIAVALLQTPTPYSFDVLYPGRRLYEPNEFSYEEELRRMEEFARDNRVCYSGYVPFADGRSSQERLLFSCLRDESEPAVIVNPEVADFLRRLAAEYRGGDDWNMRQHVGLILYNAVYSLLFLQGRQQLPEQWKPLLEELSTTPSGQLALVEFLANSPGLVLSSRRAKLFAQAAEQNLPLLSRRRAARLLSAMGDIVAAVEPRNEEVLKEARRYHTAAADMIQAATAPGVRRALDFYRREELTDAVIELYARYGAAALNAPAPGRVE